MKAALCGNPNVGKTTLFNRLTHSDAPVGNWHGVTVDVLIKRMGEHTLCDVPGAYSLNTRSADEQIARERMLFGDDDVIIYVAEVNDLRRNLYLLTQLLEAGKRAVLVVNMMDEARGNLRLDLLSKRLGVPVVGTSLKAKNPKEDIVRAAKTAASSPVAFPAYCADPRIASVRQSVRAKAIAAGISPDYAAMAVTERNADIIKRLNAAPPAIDEFLPARLRYGYIDGVLKGVIGAPAEHSRTFKIDNIVLGRLALPIFLLVICAVFCITFYVGAPISDMLTGLLGKASDAARDLPLPDWCVSLLCDGVIAGVGGVLAFLPQVVILFLLTALLQDSGYMSRVAFATDGFFQKFGLCGRAAFSLVLGLGCSVTAVLSSRGISDGVMRRRAAFVTPFCPCSARLSVFVALAASFGLGGLTVAAVYALGFVAALAVLKLMSVFGKKPSAPPALLEMPPYRLPSAKRVLSVVWHNAAAFTVRVGTVVFAVSVIMWVLCSFSVARGFGDTEYGMMRTLAQFIAPVFAPLGFGSWKAVAALISGVAAKESVISVISSLGGASAVFSGKLAACSFMIFTCLYIPCVATLGALGKECGAKTALASAALHTALAYVASLVFYSTATGILYRPALTAALWGGAAAITSACLAAAMLAKHRTASAVRKRHGKKA